MAELFVQLVTRLLLAAGFFVAAFGIAYCAYPPSPKAIQRLGNCLANPSKAVFTLADEQYSIPGGFGTYIQFPSIPDTFRPMHVRSTKDDTDTYVFCSDELADRPEATRARVGRKEWREFSSQSEFFSKNQTLRYIHLETIAYFRGISIPAAEAHNNETLSLIEVQKDVGPSREVIHITNSANSQGYRAWSSCSAALQPSFRNRCTVGIVRESDGLVAYIWSVSPEELPVAGEQFPSEISTVTDKMPLLVEEFRIAN